MDHPFNIKSGDLCRILSAKESDLNAVESAIRKALEKYFPDSGELESVRQRACLDDATAEVSIGTIRRPTRL